MADSLHVAYVENALGDLGRFQMLKRVGWIWKSSRAIALRSGRWIVLPWLVLLLLSCVALGLKSLLLPRARDLRFLLGGREFLCLLVSEKG